MSEPADRIRGVAEAIFASRSVAFAYVFGSYAAGSATARSDVDVAVYCEPLATDELGIRLTLMAALEEFAGIADADVVVLNHAPLSLAGRVQECHELVYRGDEIARIRYESLISRMYHDQKIREQRSARDRIDYLTSRS